MIKEISQSKDLKLKKINSNEIQSSHYEQQQRYFNPIVKHTYDSLPKIYGTNHKRKKKYNLNFKSNLQLRISNLKASNISPKHQCWHTKLIQLQKERQKAHSCLEQLNKQLQSPNKREIYDKTAIKKVNNIRIATQPVNQTQLERNNINQQFKNKRRILNQDFLLNLAKPRQKCNNQYCSCKSLYQEYHKQISKKKRQRQSSNITGRKQNLSRVKLPRLSMDIRNPFPKKLQDHQSNHKVNFRLKMNSMNQQLEQNDGCYLCKKNQQLNTNLAAKGIWNLIKKRQNQQMASFQNKKGNKQSENQSVAVQYQNEDLDKCSQFNDKRQDHATQANIKSPVRKNQTVDQQVNTIDHQQKKDFVHLQNKRYSQHSQNCPHYQQISPCTHKQNIDHLKNSSQKYNHKKKFVSQSAYTQNDSCQFCKCNRHNKSKQGRNERQRRQDERKKRSKKQKLRSNSRYQAEQQFDMNMESQSAISQNSLARHLANAIDPNNPNKSDRKTIFWLLNKKQQESSNEDPTSNRNKTQRKNRRNIQMVNQKTQLFTIPEEQQYVDYLKNYKPIDKNFKLKNLFKSQNFRIIRYGDTLYFGQTQNNQTKHGQALFITPKQIFQGYYQNGIKMSGCQRNIDGVYIGQFLNGLRHGKGRFLWNNGQLFEGQYKFGTKNGFGVWKGTRGDSYEGQWRLNRQHGKGTHKHKNSVYTGQFKNSFKDGQGQQIYANGDTYNGTYLNGKAHGKGRYKWKDGSLYEGQFIDGLRQGYGVWSEINNFKYEGQFKKDLKHGKGTQTYPNGDSYEGEFKQGIKCNGIFKQFSTGKQTKIKQ